ncbi:MAG: GNAT family N-acetyltransferase [Candidatus Pacebacteria bacterium]|nr:GNAT family N-acetyltransferase [Candidatus Paceibacterota bacterium]
MNIRKANLNDVRNIVELNRLLNKQHVALDPIWAGGDVVNTSFEKRLKEDLNNADSLHLVAEDNEKLVAWFEGSIEETLPYFTERKIGHIRSVYVLPEFRKQGITKAGVNMLFNWFKEHGIKLAELSVASENKEAVEVWEKLGFMEYKKRMKREI